MSIKSEVENLFEQLRDELVKLLGDHATVHLAVDDAKAATANFVPVTEEVPVTDPTEVQKEDSLTEENK